jgi:hypothetical protein
MIESTPNDSTPNEVAESATAQSQYLPVKAGNRWTTAIRVFAWINVAAVISTAGTIVLASVLWTAFMQLGDVTTNPPAWIILAAVAVGLGFIAFAVWLALSLSPNERISPNRRLVALAMLTGGLIFASVGSLFISRYAFVYGLIVLAVVFQAWRSAYRLTTPKRTALFLAVAILTAPFSALTAGSTVMTLATTLGESSGLIFSDVQESARTSISQVEAVRLWQEIQVEAAYEQTEITPEFIKTVVADFDLTYDTSTGLVILGEDSQWYICTTGPQEKACTSDQL